MKVTPTCTYYAFTVDVRVCVYSQTCSYGPLRVTFTCRLRTGLLSPFEICNTLLYKGNLENCLDADRLSHTANTNAERQHCLATFVFGSTDVCVSVPL